MKLGYARVSSTDQNLERQIQELEKAGAKKIYQEKISGASAENREQLQELLRYAREEDTIIVESLDRLGRNYDDIIEIVQQLDKNKVGLVVLNLPVLSQEMGDPSISKLLRTFIIQLLSWTAENERNEIRRKQAQGISVGKEKGIYKGRPKKYSPTASNKHDRFVYEKVVTYLTEGKAVKEIARETNVNKRTVYRIRNEMKSTSISDDL